MSDPIKDATCWLLLKKPWYGTFVSMIRWRENDQCPSMGVCIRRDGTVAGVWNAEFVKQLTRKELATVLMHEADHVIRLHTVRRLDRWPELWNVAADMVINGPKDNPHLVIEGECHLPTFPPTEPGGKPISCVYNKFDPAWTTEEVFNALKKEHPVLRDAELDFKVLPLKAYCARCAAHYTLSHIELLCPDCGEPLEIEGGREMTITFVEVFDV